MVPFAVSVLDLGPGAEPERTERVLERYRADGVQATVRELSLIGRRLIDSGRTANPVCGLETVHRSVRCWQ